MKRRAAAGAARLGRGSGPAAAAGDFLRLHSFFFMPTWLAL